jgi:hypothetical protein
VEQVTGVGARKIALEQVLEQVYKGFNRYTRVVRGTKVLDQVTRI